MNFCNRPLLFLTLLSIGLASPNALLRLQAADDEQRSWCFQPVHAASPPAVQNQQWPNNAIDAFILAKLEHNGLAPSTPADRRSLIRRTTFDLTGMPPTREEIDAFLADESPDAFARIIDRLLASPRFGERWGRHWLDVVRYADARDLIQLPAESDFREAWRYRDWVVQSFNRDLPYDRFIAMQVAGDLMQPADKTQIDADALVATGLLAIADFVPGDVDKQQMIADYVNDQIDVVGRAILGLTLACARCHDHKFDPITTEDYYSLAGIFFSTRLVPGPVKGNTPLVKIPLLPAGEIAAIEAGQARDKARIAELVQEINNFGEREYCEYLDRCVEAETLKYLLAAWKFAASATDLVRPTEADVAKASGLDATTFSRWIACLNSQPPNSALAAIRTAPDQTVAEHRTRELSLKLSELAATRRRAIAGDPIAKTLDESLLMQIRADDPRIVSNASLRVSCWPNRSRRAGNAIPVPDVAAPSLITDGSPGKFIHFSGNELLQVERTIPAVGSLFVVFRPDSTGGAGQRLIGWEDSAVGQHGLGIMTDGAGSLHVILRRNGASGDVVVPATADTRRPNGFQNLCVTWGPNGVCVFRDGQPVGTNKAIDSVSSDPAITALRIGGPGSGSSSRFQGDVAELRVYSAPLDEAARSRINTELTKRWLEHSETSGPAETLNPVEDLYDELVSANSPFRLEPKERSKAFPTQSQARLTAFTEELEALKKKTAPEIPRAVVVQEGGPADTPHAGFHDAHVYIRGNHANPGKTVPRGFPKVIAGIQPTEIREGSGRKELASWLTATENPLTARVMVNRTWQHHFGVGIVPSSANFGAMGAFPSHPELLDFLASGFVKSGWSMKTLHRLMLESNVFQQTSASNAAGINADPENRLLWHANRRRLEAEAFRDSLFSVAARIDCTLGGPGFQDVSTPRRSLYLMSVRTGAKSAEFGPLFDAPDCSGIVERRNESIVAPQALFLMNDPFVTQLAEALAERVIRESDDVNNHDRIRRLYETVLGRLPTELELDVGLQLLADQSPAVAWASYCRLVVSLNEFMFVD